jgi:hypothetical protein
VQRKLQLAARELQPLQKRRVQESTLKMLHPVTTTTRPERSLSCELLTGTKPERSLSSSS